MNIVLARLAQRHPHTKFLKIKSTVSFRLLCHDSPIFSLRLLLIHFSPPSNDLALEAWTQSERESAREREGHKFSYLWYLHLAFFFLSRFLFSFSLSSSFSLSLSLCVCLRVLLFLNLMSTIGLYPRLPWWKSAHYFSLSSRWTNPSICWPSFLGWSGTNCRWYAPWSMFNDAMLAFSVMPCFGLTHWSLLRAFYLVTINYRRWVGAKQGGCGEDQADRKPYWKALYCSAELGNVRCFQGLLSLVAFGGCLRFHMFSPMIWRPLPTLL